MHPGKRGNAGSRKERDKTARTVSDPQNARTDGGEETRDALLDSPRMTPMPTPLAIPLSRLLRAHGISLIRFRSSEDILFLAGARQ